MSNNRHIAQVIEFLDELSEPIKLLKCESLGKFFRIEEGDIASLSNPKKHILNQGVYIYYAKLKNEIVGTFSLLKKNETIYDLGKMAVRKTEQGHGIGKMLLEHCLNVTKQKKHLHLFCTQIQI